MTRPVFARGTGTSPMGPAGRDGTDGTDGLPGLPGVNAVANDTATAAYVSNPTSATAAALSISYGAQVGLDLRRDFGLNPSQSAGALHTAITDAVEAAISGGRDLSLGHEAWKIDAPLVIPGAVTLRGEGVRAINSGQGFYGPDQAPFFEGGMLVQTAAGADAIQITGHDGDAMVSIRDLAVTFQGSHAFKNTGHGIRAVSDALYSGGPRHQNSVGHSLWSNVHVVGHDGNHYGYRLINASLNTFIGLRSYGGGGMLFEVDSVTPLGNSVFVHSYHEVYVGGSAHGFLLRGYATGTGHVNLIEFTRPQSVIIQPPAALASLSLPVPVISQHGFKVEGQVDHVNLTSPDFEGDGVLLYPVNFGGAHSTVTLSGLPLFGGVGVIDPGQSPGTNAGHYNSGDRSRPGNPTPPTITKGPGLGTTGAASVLQGDEYNGVILLTWGGSSLGAPGDVLATVTCPTLPAGGILQASVAGYAAGYSIAKDWYTSDYDAASKSFKIRAVSTFGAGEQHQITYSVQPFQTGLA